MATIVDLRPNGAHIANVCIVSTDLKVCGPGPSQELARALTYISPYLENQVKTNNLNLADMFMAKNQLFAKAVTGSEPLAPSSNIVANKNDSGMTVG